VQDYETIENSDFHRGFHKSTVTTNLVKI